MLRVCGEIRFGEGVFGDWIIAPVEMLLPVVGLTTRPPVGGNTIVIDGEVFFDSVVPPVGDGRISQVGDICS